MQRVWCTFVMNLVCKQIKLDSVARQCERPQPCKVLLLLQAKQQHLSVATSWCPPEHPQILARCLHVTAAQLGLNIGVPCDASISGLASYAHLRLLSFWPLICLQELHQARQGSELLLICCCPLLDLSLPCAHLNVLLQSAQ